MGEKNNRATDVKERRREDCSGTGEGSILEKADMAPAFVPA